MKKSTNSLETACVRCRTIVNREDGDTRDVKDLIEDYNVPVILGWDQGTVLCPTCYDSLIDLLIYFPKLSMETLDQLLYK